MSFQCIASVLPVLSYGSELAESQPRPRNDVFSVAFIQWPALGHVVVIFSPHESLRPPWLRASEAENDDSVLTDGVNSIGTCE